MPILTRRFARLLARASFAARTAQDLTKRSPRADSACASGARTGRRGWALLAALLLLLAVAPVLGQSWLDNIPVGQFPLGVAVNPVTNRIYVANNHGYSVTVIDGATTKVSTIPVGSFPVMIAVNTITDRIYVLNQASEDVTVIDGATNSILATVPQIGSHPQGIVVNQATNKIYITSSSGLTELDGLTDAVINVNTAGALYQLAINPVTNKIYAVNESGFGIVTVIDGATHATTTVVVGNTPWAIDVNPVTNTIYVANAGDNTVSVIDGASNTVTDTVTVGNDPCTLAVNAVTNTIWVSNRSDTTVTEIDGSSNATTVIDIGGSPEALAANPSTNTVYTLCSYANDTEGLVAINGETGGVSTLLFGPLQSYSLAVDPLTNRVYLSNDLGYTLSVIDGAVNKTSAIYAGSYPTAVAVNPITNMLYSLNQISATVTSVNLVTNVATTIGVGYAPIAIDLNPVTNTIYVTNSSSSNVSVIDGITQATTTVNVGNSPISVAVNPATNKIYVANYGDGTVSVIDGATNATTTLKVGAAPYAVAVNQTTNMIYVCNKSDGTVSVIDGASNAITSVSVGSQPMAIAVNPATNKIYVANNGNGAGNTVTVIDGATNTTTNVTVGTAPIALAVNITTNKIFVANFNDTVVSVIDGDANTAVSVQVGQATHGIVVNPVTNRAYAISPSSAIVTEIDGASHGTVYISEGGSPAALAVNAVTNRVFVANSQGSTVTAIDVDGSQPAPLSIAVRGVTDAQTVANPALFVSTNRTPSFTATVTSNFANTSPYAGDVGLLSPSPAALYYWVDSGGPQLWSAAAASTGLAANPAQFSIQLVNQLLGMHTLYLFADYGDEGGDVGNLLSQGGSPTVSNIQAISFAILPLATTTTVVADVNPQNSGDNVTFTATVTPTPAIEGAASATGSVSFYDGATLLGSSAVSTGGGSATAAFQTNALTAGAHSIAATYSGDANYSGSSASMAENIAGVPASMTILSGKNQSATVGAAFPYALQVQVKDAQGIPVSDAAVTFAGTGLSFSSGGLVSTDANGEASVDATATGSGTLMATASVSGIAPVTFTESATAVATTVALTTSANTQVYGQSITLTATLSPYQSGSDSTNGSTISFQANGQTIGTGALTGGVASFTTTALPVGTLPLTAVYTPSASSTGILASTSNTVNDNISAAPLVVTVSNATMIYGTLLPSFSGSVAGIQNNDPVTASYATTATANSPANTYPINATLSGAALSNYAVTAKPGTLTIAKAQATITLSNLTQTYTGLALPVSTSVTPANLTLNLTYNGSSTPPTSAGSYAVVGTIADANYQASANATLVIAQAKPVLTWTPPQAISYGTALSATQLNATSTTPGVFLLYSPGSGTVLSAGLHSLFASFLPTDVVDYTSANATVSINVNQATPSITWLTPSSISYGTPLSATQLNATSHVAGTFSYSAAAGTVLSPGAQTLTVTFTPTDALNYTSATGSVILQVSKATPSITWANPAAIAYGTALSAIQLNATSSIAGTFVYSPAAGTVLTTGSQTLEATFIPTDSVDYSKATATVTLTINKATPSITWATPSAISYGTALSAAQLNATSTTAGTFTYTPASGTVLLAGAQTLTVTFTPTDAVDYDTATGSVTMQVSKATPSITWANPTAIAYGTALSATQLNATSTTPGVFLLYSPGSGTVLSAGLHSLFASFLPTDAVDYNSTNATVSINVNQATPSITWSTPSSISYGTPLSATQLNATSHVAGTFVYSASAGTVLLPGAQTLTVTFTPTDALNYTSATGSVILQVSKATPSITWANPAAIAYGTALSATQLNATSSIAGTFVYSPAAGTVLTTGSQTLEATFIPTDSVDYSKATATVTLTINKATPSITWATPSAISYGTALNATQLNATSSTAGTFAYTPASGTLLSAGLQTLTVLFTPTDAVNYAAASATVAISVNKATPSVTWVTPSAITYGTPLSAMQLNATSNVAGTFAYSVAPGIVLSPGAQTLTVTFTPTDATDYNLATGSVTMQVSKATSSITWTNPTAIPYGTALSAIQLNATSNIPGSFVYSPAAGTVLTTGPQTLEVTFTPTDSADYSKATATVTLTINKATPSITWATPSAISYGTALSAAQLNATPTTAGTFAYTPASGTVLSAGLQTLTVLFTPVDTTDYATANSTVSINVNQEMPSITWARPSSISYGTALSVTQLNASTAVAGVIAYTPAIGTVLSVGGHQTLLATFTPADTADYATASSTVSINVNQATPSITWATPSAIPYGTAISATQLNATSTTTGTFAYTPALGTVLSAGSQPLTVLFTPTDATDYTAVSASSTLIVGKATPIEVIIPSASSITTAQSLTLAVSLSSGSNSLTGVVTLSSGTYTTQQTLVAGSTTFAIAAGTLALGSDSIAVVYTPDNSSANNYATVTQVVPVVVTTASASTATQYTAPTVTVTPSITTMAAQQSLTVTVSVAGLPGQATPTGIVTLASGPYSTQQTLINGAASFTLPDGTLSSGVDTLTASYAGDLDYPAASGTTNVTVDQVVFSTTTPTPVTPGGSTTVTVTGLGGGAYTGTLNLICALASSPVGASSLPTCILTPSSITLKNGSNGTTALTVNTTAATTSALVMPARQNLGQMASGGVALAALLLFGIPSRRRWLSMLALLLIVLAGGTMGCAGSSSTGSTSTSSGSSSGITTMATTAGSYTFTVTGTDSVNAKLAASTTITVIVQ